MWAYNLSLNLNWEKIANINGFSTHIDFVSRLGSSNVSSKYVAYASFRLRKYTAPRRLCRPSLIGDFYGEQQLFTGNAD